MRVFSIISFLFLFTFCCVAQEQHKYSCDDIPLPLRTGAKAVIRSCQRRITIVNERRAVLETRMAITLLNDKALNLLMIGLPYDKLRKISGINARAYNENGKLIWTLNKYNILDKRNFNGPQKLDDSRKKVFEIPSFNYPFTIEYSYKVTASDLLMSPEVLLQPESGISIEESGLQYVIPHGIGFHYKMLNFNTPVDSVVNNKKLYLTWKVEGIPAARPRPYEVSPQKILPVIYATPLDYTFAGYKGSFKSWNEYGKWMANLVKGRDQLDSIYIKKINLLTDTCKTTRSIIRVLYGYLQKSTHYFYVGFGIGASQPIPANEVAKNGYGDCKALSNYMKAMLKYKGIESFYTLAPSGEGRDLLTDIPCNQFDHVILCVPEKNDTIWLECTNPDSPFNYLGSFTSDRRVLAITPEGGKLLKTPAYDHSKNIISTKSVITTDSIGDAQIKLEIRSKGLMSDEIYNLAETMRSERKQWLTGRTGFVDFNLVNESYKFTKTGDIPEAIASFEIELRNFASRSGNIMVLSPSLFSRLSFLKYNPSKIEINRSYQENDSVVIILPAQFEVYYVPESRNDSCSFGSFSTTLDQNENSILFSRLLKYNKGIYPESDFPRFHKFINEIARTDNEKVVLNSKRTSLPDSPDKHP